LSHSLGAGPAKINHTAEGADNKLIPSTTAGLSPGASPIPREAFRPLPEFS